MKEVHFPKASNHHVGLDRNSSMDLGNEFRGLVKFVLKGWCNKKHTRAESTSDEKYVVYNHSRSKMSRKK